MVKQIYFAPGVLYCKPCEEGTHTNPPDGSILCMCGERTCACFTAGGKIIVH